MKIKNLDLGEFVISKIVQVNYNGSIIDGKITGLYMDCEKNSLSIEITIGGINENN